MFVGGGLGEHTLGEKLRQNDAPRIDGEHKAAG